MIGFAAYVRCRPAVHHALMCKKRCNVPVRAARNGCGQACLGSMIMEACCRRTYRCQKLIKGEIGGSWGLVVHPVQPNAATKVSPCRLIGHEANDDGGPPKRL
jgi:hypothetical protein